jgi:hypothetical protein
VSFLLQSDVVLSSYTIRFGGSFEMIFRTFRRPSKAATQGQTQ